MKKSNIFKDENKKSSFKYFIISFCVFILILAVISVFVFMKSINFDFNNITNNGEEKTTIVETTTENMNSLDHIHGCSNLLFVCENNKNEFVFAVTIFTDFDNKIMRVNSYEKSDNQLVNLYKISKIDGIKSYISNLQKTKIDKFAVISENKLKDMVSIFGNITVNVPYDIKYNSDNIKLELTKGENTLSPEYFTKYLKTSDKKLRCNIICDFINFVLTPNFTTQSDKLFPKFINCFDTDISVIDYSENIDNIIAYSNAQDKFVPICE